MRRVYVAGVGLTRVGRHFDKGLLELAAEAAFKAIDEVQLKPEAVIVANMLSSTLQEQDNLGSYIAGGLGLSGTQAFKVEAGDGSGGAALLAAYSLIASGTVSSVLVVGVEKMTDYPTSTVYKASSQVLDAEYELYYGATMASLHAMMMRRYMEKYEVPRDLVSEWPVLMHENGAQNPFAQIRRRISKDDVARSQIISDPITLMDSSPLGDGAAALLLVSDDEASRVQSKPPVELVGVVSASDNVEFTARSELASIPAAREAAKKLQERFGVKAGEVDVVELHDSYTIAGLLLLEELGIADRGTAPRLLSEGRFRAGDRPAINLSGGLKSRGHPLGATGVYQAAEVVMQLRGDFPGLRQEGAETGIAVSMSGVGAFVSVALFRRV
ncbi:MAG: acetyl-CoA acetyltransferase [Thermoproteota archaeon]